MGQDLTIWQLVVCRAAAHSEVNKFAEAIADCENVIIRIDPKYSKAYSRLGWVYHAQGHFEEAIEKGFQKGLVQAGSHCFCLLQIWTIAQKSCS
jgi:tetratricopeptide (TPR) repeat protein